MLINNILYSFSQFPAIECPEINNVNLQGCKKHHLDICDVECVSGYSSIYSIILCENGQWDVANPCKQSKYLESKVHFHA